MLSSRSCCGVVHLKINIKVFCNIWYMTCLSTLCHATTRTGHCYIFKILWKQERGRFKHQIFATWLPGVHLHSVCVALQNSFEGLQWLFSPIFDVQSKENFEKPIWCKWKLKKQLSYCTGNQSNEFVVRIALFDKGTNNAMCSHTWHYCFLCRDEM